MADALHSRQVVRFGVFEVDLRSGELRKNGLKIKLQEQPFQVLAMLLEHPGEVVHREDLRAKLWPADTFVDFEHGLNAAINKLREALGDSADNPRFVETLHRRGYRFIYPVEVGEHPRGAPALSEIPREGRKGPPLPRRWVVAMAAMALLAIAVLAYRLTRPLPPPRVTNAVRIARLHGGTWFAPLLTDGVRLYFTDWLGDRSVIMQVPIAGGEAVAIPTPFQFVEAADISVNRSELLVAGGEADSLGKPLWVLPLVGGSPRRVGDIVSNGGSWSPDGKEIVYNRGSDLFLAKSDGTESRKLASAPGQIYFMNWSPDGTTIRFNAFDPKVGTSILYEVLADGTNLHRLLPGWTKSPGGECCGIWTADGKYFIFDAAGKGVLHDTLWAIREKTGLFRRQNLEPERLTSDPVNYIAPLPSPDGKKLYAIGWLSRGELMRYDAKAGQFVSLLPGVSASDADFSRDGQWVVYVSYLDRTLWRSRVDGSESLQLTFPPTRALLPRWSPDGKRIAFMGRSPGKPWKIHLVSTEGGAPRQLISDERREFDPQWSPDGSQLLFGRGPVNSSSPPTLCLLDLRTGQVSEVPGSEGLGWPRWSYDGRYVAAIQDGDKRLVLFDFTTHRQVELAATKGSFSLPNWSHDGKWIYLWADFAEDRKGIYRVQLTDGKVELVASDKEVGRISGTSGPWVGLAPDDSPLVMRDISLTEIYAFDWAAP